MSNANRESWRCVQFLLFSAYNHPKPANQPAFFHDADDAVAMPSSYKKSHTTSSTPLNIFPHTKSPIISLKVKIFLIIILTLI